MAGGDHPNKGVATVGESNKGKVILEEGEIPEDEDSKAANESPPPLSPPLPPPPLLHAITTSSSSNTITVEVPPVKKRSSATASTRQVPCPLCQRMFDSYPAMFGHQRVHKERTYRGAFPPPTFSREGSPPATPTAEDTEEAAHHAAQLLINISKGVWEKTPAAVPGEASVLSARSMLRLDLNFPLEPEEEEEEDRKKNLNLDLNKSPQDSN